MTRALRVLHIVSGDLWAGAEVQAFTLMSHLARLPKTEVAAALMNDETLADRLRSIGITTYVLDEQRTNSLRLFLKLRNVLRAWRPDVVHTHRLKENILGSLANRSCGNVPSVRTVHGADEILMDRGLRAVRRRIVAGVDLWCGRILQQRVIAVTQTLGIQLRKGFHAHMVAVIENGVDSESVIRERGVAEYRTSEPGATHVGIAGRLVRVKRVDLFIEAAALLLREHPARNWQFHIFGDGADRRRLETLSGRLNLGNKVVFHGHRQDIATCIGGLDALVICSDHEGMPMVSLEAAALAVPTIAHAVGGLVEVVPAEFLVTRHDARGYRDGILRALRPDGRNIAAKFGIEAAARFSARGNAEKIRMLYEELLAERSGRGTGVKWRGDGGGAETDGL